MALQWQWDNRCGEAVFVDTQSGKETAVNIYEGNAFMIFLREWKEGEDNMYSMYSFFVDEDHAKSCLGLTKDNSNIFNDGFTRLRTLRLNKNRCRNINKIVKLFIKANFDRLTIEFYSDEK